MSNGLGKMVLMENKSANPRYSLSYRRGVLNKGSKKISYDLISRLVGGKDLLLKVDSSLFTGLSPEDEAKLVETIIMKLREMNIEYRYRTNSYPKKSKVFGFSISTSQTVTEHEILAYIPNRIWVKEGFWEFLPEYGVTYHILSPETNGSKLLDDIHTGRLLDKEILENYDLTIFDCFSFGQMGIDTDLSKQDLEGLLKVEG